MISLLILYYDGYCSTDKKIRNKILTVKDENNSVAVILSALYLESFEMVFKGICIGELQS